MVEMNEGRIMGHLVILYLLSGNSFGFSYSIGDPSQWDKGSHFHGDLCYSVN